MKTHVRILTAAILAIVAVPSFAQLMLEEVMVTAQRRQESVQDAAIAVDVVTAETIVRNGITSTEDLSRYSPGLTVTNGGGASSQLYMRGVGNRTTSAYIDPAIVVSYDGVPMGRASGAATAAYFDLDRVEILKGPQGTLYGRNATGGAINIEPVDPRIDENGGYFSASVGNYGLMHAQGAVNAAVGDQSALRISANFIQRDGYNRDGTNDADSSGLRIQYLTQPNEDLDIKIGFDYSDQGGFSVGTSYLGTYAPTGQLGSYTWIPSGLDPNEGMNTDAGNAYRGTLLGAPGFGFLEPIQDDWRADNGFTGFNAEINYEIGVGTLTVIPAWRKVRQDTLFGMPAFNSGWFKEEDEQTSIEVRLAKDQGEFLDYIVGAFYFEETIEGNNTFNQEFVLPTQDFRQDADSLAVFAHLTWSISDTVRFVTGTRYTADSKTWDGGNDTFVVFCGGVPPTPPPESFAIGCAAPGNLPHFPTFDEGDGAAAWLISGGWVPPDADWAPAPFEPLLNGVGAVARFPNTFKDSYTDSDTTYRLALEWNVGEDSMMYVSYETGYRSGGFQLSPSAPQYAPEYIDALTFGSKNRFADGRLQLNFELFHWQYEDQQISYFTVDPTTAALENLTDNVGDATNQGFDVDLQWQARDYSLISLKTQYLDASYDELIFLAPPPRDNINCPNRIAGATNTGAPILEFDCSGQTAVFSPEWVVFFGIEQTFPLGSLDLVGTLTSRYMDEQVGGFWNLEGEKIDSQVITDLDITLRPSGGNWSISAFVHNLEDEHRIQLTQTSPLGPGVASYGPDTTFGLRANFNF